MVNQILLNVFGMFLLVFPQAPAAQENQEEAEEAPHQPSPIGSYGGIMNPDISVIADVQAFFTDNDSLDNRNKVRLKEGELAFQGYLYPGIRGDFIMALEQEYAQDGGVETSVDLEEAYASFLSLPGGLQVQGGRKYMDFGRINPVHPHHWSFVTAPHVLKNFFGEHNWFDDGVQGSILVPNPADIYIKVTAGVWNGRILSHHHGEEGQAAEGEEDTGQDHTGGPDDESVIDWDGHVMTGRVSLGFMAGENADFLCGISYARDTQAVSSVIGSDLTCTYNFPGTYRRLRWQTEFMRADAGDRGTKPWGVYSMLRYTLNKYWEFGGRFDRAEYLQDDDNEVTGGSLFTSYYLTHTTYIRGEYQYADYSEMGEDNLFQIQFVWGLGPHAHRLQD